MTTERKTWRGAPGEAQTSGPRFAARSLLLRRVFKRKEPSRALDIGCGRGGITRILARYATSVMATEVTPQSVEAASDGLQDCDNVNVRMANLFDGGSDDLSNEGPFDLILLSEVLEHLNDDVGALKIIHSLLTEDGLLVITVPRDPRFWSVEDELWDHKRRYERTELEGKLRDTGFELDLLWTWGFPITKRIVKFQVNRLRPRGSDVRDGPPLVARPPSLLLPLARIGFGMIARFEQIFKGTDRGLGYVATARKVR
jgi:SAM-dependent methyltransferase